MDEQFVQNFWESDEKCTRGCSFYFTQAVSISWMTAARRSSCSVVGYIVPAPAMSHAGPALLDEYSRLLLWTPHLHQSVSTCGLHQLGTQHLHLSMSAGLLRWQRTECMPALSTSHQHFLLCLA